MSINTKIKLLDDLQMGTFAYRLNISLDRNNDDLFNPFFNIPDSDVDQVSRLDTNIKTKILVDFVSLDINKSENIVPTIIIIATQYLFEMQQIELAIDALTKTFKNSNHFFFDKNFMAQIIEVLNLMNQNKNLFMVQKCISLVNIIIKNALKSSELMSENILLELIHSNLHKTLMKCDMKLSHVTKCYLYVLKFHEHLNILIYDENELTVILKNSIDALSFYTSSLSTFKQEIQNEKNIKHLFKCVSLCPRNFNLDCLLIDLIIYYFSNHPSLEIKEVTLKTAIKKGIKSQYLNDILFEQIKFHISEEIKGNSRQNISKFLLTCIKYLNITFDIFFKESRIDFLLKVIEYVIDNKNFELVNSVLPIVERIFSKTHSINMKLEESLINHIDNSEIGKLCLITSFMAIEIMTPQQFSQTLKMFNEIYPLLDDLYQSELSDQMIRWIIESIWQSES